jgi:cyclopropane-fatty-acyl-phospholipid synthase
MSLDSTLARVARPRLFRTLESWEVGQLLIHLPDGEVRRFGPTDAHPCSEVFIERESFFRKLALGGDMGVGESYMDGDWRADDLPRFVSLALQNRRHLPLETPLSKLLNLGHDLFHRLRANTRQGSRRNVRDHYDLSNALFELFLDETLTYSSAFFEWRGQDLADAQRAKYRRLADKLEIGARDRVLEIGCGFGGFAIFAAREYGCRVTGITLSKAQHDLAWQRVAAAGLGHRVEIRLQDYRDLSGAYDKIVSIEMFEALGREHWRTFFEKCEQVLVGEGRIALQTISIPSFRFEEYTRHCDWLQRYIFPGSLLASIHHVTGSMVAAGTLGVHHLEDIGIHYAETLARWRRRFLGRLDAVRALGFDERFIRMWDYYLSTCQAAFATRTLGNLQWVLTRPGNAALPGIPAHRAQAA